MNKYLLLLFCLFVVSSLVGCTGRDLEPTGRWTGVFWGAGEVDGAYWFVLETVLGNVTKVIGRGDYGFLLDLPTGVFYSFFIHVDVGWRGDRLSPTVLVSVEDEMGILIWSR